MGTANPWFKQFGDEWVPSTARFKPDDSIPADKRVAVVSQASRSLRDFYVWGLHRMIAQSGARGLYFDVSRPVDDSNIYHGAGTPMPDGSVAPQRNILGMRKSFERIYTMLKKEHPRDGVLFWHTSGQVIPPIASFCDALLDGENFDTVLDRKNNRGYEHVLSLAQFRTEYAAQNNFGPATLFLPQFTRSGAVKRDEWKKLGYTHAQYLLGLILLHDSSLWCSYFPYEVYAQVYGALDKTGWDATWSFIPYWRQKAFNLPHGMAASLYLSPDRSRAVVVIMNISGRDRSVDLPLSGAGGMLRSSTAASAVYPDEPVRLDNGAVRQLSIRQNNFRIILLN